MNRDHIRPRRSLIFVPGNRPDRYPKALGAGADIVTVDLEDAIAPQHKDEARETTLRLFSAPPADDGIERMVRINCLRTPEGLADLQAIIKAESPPPALMLPKVKSPDEIRVHEELLDGPHRHIRFHVIIETNEGLETCSEIARSSERIDSLLFGGVDMAAELRVEPHLERAPLRSVSTSACGSHRRTRSHRRAVFGSRGRRGAGTRSQSLRRPRHDGQSGDSSQTDPGA